MGRPCKIPKDLTVYAKLIEDLAYGLPQVLIANALEVSESAITRWKKQKDFGRDLAKRKLEILAEPIKSIAENSKLIFLERHPDTREEWSPPIIKQENTHKGEVVFRVINDISYSDKKLLEK